MDDSEETVLEVSGVATADRSFSVVEEAAFSDVCSPFCVCSEVFATSGSGFSGVSSDVSARVWASLSPFVSREDAEAASSSLAASCPLFAAEGSD